MKRTAAFILFASIPFVFGQESNGLAPEVTDLNAEDVSYAKEKNIPDLKEPFIDALPEDFKDGVPVGELGDRPEILAFAKETAEGQHGEVDSLLIAHEGKLIFESYFRRGRVNYPHYQMSITKSYTAMAIGRAIQLGHLKMSDLERPVVDFLEDLDRENLAEGAEGITLHEAMNMRSGIRLDLAKVNELRRVPGVLKGQGQIQAYLTHSAPIKAKTFKYQGADPSITMQVLDASIPSLAREFIQTELLGKLGITNYAWQEDVSGLPKSAAGSSMRSRDMIKWGLLTMDKGRWRGEQLIPEAFVEKATGRLHTNAQHTSYGYFWWRADVRVDGRTYDCKSGRGAGGQFILMFEELDLLVVITAHNKGMGGMLGTAPKRVLPSFVPKAE